MEQQLPPASGPSPGPAPGKGDGAPPPGIADAVRELRDSGLAGMGAAREAAGALRTLVTADVSLARSAAGRSAVFAGLAVVFGASAWMMLMTAVVVALSNQVGLPWWLSLACCALGSCLAAWLALRKAMAYFEHTRMKATRRQLARLGIGELSGFMPDAGSAECARDAEDRARPGGDGVPGDSTPAGVTPP
ncbi:phage holin family protein [Luteimonas sp. MJ174]|uniref:phage holin family protein n=1 Tax=Luteimonas sp. MJ174 TaxID=3129237 RepID=UPI0031BA1773